MPSFINLNDQIELNEKRLDFEYKRYETYYSRFTFVSVLYSVLAIYFVQLIRFCFSEENDTKFIYSFFLSCFVLIVLYSVYNAICLLMPKDISFQQLPYEFYKNIKEQYQEMGIKDEVLLNEYIRASYNSQLEEAVSANAQLCIEKSKYYFRSFRFALFSIIPYLICTSMYMSCAKEKSEEIRIRNYRDIVLYNDSINHNTKNKQILNEPNNQNHMSDVPKINETKVIHPKPIVVREGQSVKIKK